MANDNLRLRAKAQLELQHREIDKLCGEWIVSHKRGPLYWARNLTRTENYQWQKQGLPQFAPIPYRPHPEFSEEHLRVLDEWKVPHELSMADPPDYLDVLMGFLLLMLPEMHVPKTRTMITSWLVMHFITWHCQWRAAIEWVGQSEDDGKAMGLVEYANILYRNQPDWLKSRHPLRGKFDEGTQHRIEWEHSSRFIGIPQGERKFASKHSHGYFNDESAHQSAWKSTVNIVKPAVMQVVNVSSVAPSDFWDEVSA